MSMGHRQKGKPGRGVTSKFVMPLAGTLSAISARLYDMGEGVLENQQDSPSMFMTDDASLMRVEGLASADTARAVRSATVTVTTGLFIAVVAVFSLFFGVRDAQMLHHASASISSLAFGETPRKLAATLMPGYQNTGGSSADTKVCVTPTCWNTSMDILLNLSPNYKKIDPCTDFEELVCGGWNQNHVLDPDEPMAVASIFTGLEGKALAIQKEILEGPYPVNHLIGDPSAVDRENFDKIKKAYHACMNEIITPKAGVEPLIKILDEIVRLFPAEVPILLDNVSIEAREQDEIANVMTFLSKFFVTTLLDLEPGRNIENPGGLIVYARPPKLGLAKREDYQDSGALLRRESEIAEILEQLYPKSNTKPISSSFLAHGIVEFEKILAGAQPHPEDLYNSAKFWNLMPIENASELIRRIPLFRIIEALAPSGYEIHFVNIQSPDYLMALEEVLSSTPREILQAYFIHRTIDTLYIGAGFDHTRFSSSWGMWNTSEKSKICITRVRAGLRLILDHFYVQRAFSTAAAATVEQMIYNIRDAFVRRLKSLEWMDISVTERAIDKVLKVLPTVGYLSLLDSPDLLRDRYHAVNITIDSPLENFLSSARSAARRRWVVLEEEANRNEWLASATVEIEFYHLPRNRMVLPTAIMQLSMFDIDAPAYLSYGALGVILGHEISHAFDPNGKLYDQDGRYHDWWTDTTTRGLQERADCFADQYSKLTILNGTQNVNGKQTQAENIADARGLNTAFVAWSNHREMYPDLNLPGLDFTQEQLFFISYGRTFCAKQSEAYTQWVAAEGVRAPTAATRIMGTVANSRSFKESFNCKQKEPVCELW